MTPYSFEDWFTKHFQYTVFSDLQSSAREDGMNFCYHFREKVKKPHTVTKTLRHWVTYREVYESERIHPWIQDLKFRYPVTNCFLKIVFAYGVAKSQTRLSDLTFNFHFHALEKAMATHSSVLAWRILGTGEPGGLPSMGSHRVGHDWSDLAVAADFKDFPINHLTKINLHKSIWR